LLWGHDDPLLLGEAGARRLAACGMDEPRSVPCAVAAGAVYGGVVWAAWTATYVCKTTRVLGLSRLSSMAF